MNKLKALGKTINENKEVLIKRGLQGAAVAVGYFVGQAVLDKFTRGDTVVIDGDAIVEVTQVD